MIGAILPIATQLIGGLAGSKKKGGEEEGGGGIMDMLNPMKMMQKMNPMEMISKLMDMGGEGGGGGLNLMG